MKITENNQTTHRLKDKNDMPCGLDVGHEICKTQQNIFLLAMDKNFDDEDFARKYMNSEFCSREMDALYSFFHMTNTAYIMSVLLDEIHPEKNNLHYDYNAIEWIGWMYKYLQLRLEIPSKEIYAVLPLKTMLGYYPGMHTQDEEYFVNIIKEQFNISEAILHTVLIDRRWIGVLQDYFRMKGITTFETLHNNHDELKCYEETFGRKLTRLDAIVISPLTESEINEIIDGFYENEELHAFQEKENEEELKIYYQMYGKDS